MNKTKLFFALFLLICGLTCANAQSGTANLEVYVHAGKIGQSSVRLKDVKVILQPVEAWSGSRKASEAESQNNGYYFAVVSFGEYELTVSAKGYETYRAVIYLPSSVNFVTGVRLHEIRENRVGAKTGKRRSD